MDGEGEGEGGILFTSRVFKNLSNKYLIFCTGQCPFLYILASRTRSKTQN